MKFPNIGDIATIDVVSIDIKSTYAQALSKMLENEHRNILVIDIEKYYVLSIIDILNIQANNIDIKTKLCDLELLEIPRIHKNKNILETLEYLNNSVEYISVVNDDNSLYGLVTHTDITSNIDPDTLMDNYRLEDFLKLGRRMKWVKRDENISTLLKDMVANLYDNVIIVENLKPVGIFTTKDITKMIKNQDDLNVNVEKYMSSPVDTLPKNSSIRESLNFLKIKNYKRVVVVEENGNLAGIISQKELISLTYSKWAIMMKEYQEELSEINTILRNKSAEYETIASTDALTGLYNRYKFSELYLSSYKTMIQRHNAMSLILLDIDYFKKVNDIHGHNAGDAALVQVAHALLRTLRNIDIICRWGGEEFLVLLPTANLGNAIILAEKLRIQIEKTEIDVVGKITVSLGVAEVIEGDDMESIIDRADKALYLAKHSGRNCVRSQDDL